MILIVSILNVLNYFEKPVNFLARNIKEFTHLLKTTEKLYLCTNIFLMKLLLITFILLGLGIAGIAIKLWAKKDGNFAGTCASQNPMLNKNGEACGFCGRTPDQVSDCNEPQHS